MQEIPWHFSPFIWLFGYGIALLGYLYCLFVHFSSKIILTGKNNLKKDGNYIYCFWHRYIFLYFALFMRHYRHVWMQHPIWFMKPSHIYLRLIGVRKVILGSSGHAGKEAADQLVGYLKAGYSTAIMPDGPKGPPFVLKKGALHISEQSQVPIVPLKFKTSALPELNHWDRRLWPMPFKTYQVEFGQPLLVNADNFEEVMQSLSSALGEVSSFNKY